ncbi:hypothetical protein B0T26DRAFT_364299 [Lasiosphaeria miniovina]|uniref:Uncharacterized protein n=1 Tax=Lasiosphaeria miniovina TaxID=1954250 RepID=A0AA40ACK9_9PEZI|nr:uncharacterized protein B0T26DRAFT_364299 [Lasiosphaeria miniovina]KAK0713412.1 hypothetical protein B0T26DRAFT_364299 [Lasiosphaeria miniovina]
MCHAQSTFLSVSLRWNTGNCLSSHFFLSLSLARVCEASCVARDFRFNYKHHHMVELPKSLSFQSSSPCAWQPPPVIPGFFLQHIPGRPGSLHTREGIPVEPPPPICPFRSPRPRIPLPGRG